jgi:hypothetical protein
MNNSVRKPDAMNQLQCIVALLTFSLLVPPPKQTETFGILISALLLHFLGPFGSLGKQKEMKIKYLLHAWLLTFPVPSAVYICVGSSRSTTSTVHLLVGWLG